jgi:hypothetical protein
MPDDRTVKKVFLGKPSGRIKAGRPKSRWLECIGNDLKSMGVRRRRKKAEDKSAWAIILKEALVRLEYKECMPMKKKTKEKKKTNFLYLQKSCTIQHT